MVCDWIEGGKNGTLDDNRKKKKRKESSEGTVVSSRRLFMAAIMIIHENVLTSVVAIARQRRI